MTGRPVEGTIIDGRYRVLSRLGSGGMADVYCAEDLQLGRKVALKMLYRRFAEDAEFLERFRREASSAAGLQHPNVVGVYDRGEEDGTQYIAMEYVEGRTLKEIVRDGGPLEPGRAVDLVEQVLRAAKFAHKRGIIHRDLKPHNVIVDAEDRAKVADFGIALAGASDMTQTGSIMGTAQYLSPEQAQGLPVDARSDIYSVGIMLYELLTGVVPFEGDSAVAIALKQVSATPVPPSHRNPAVTPALEHVVLRALAKDPADRPQDAEAFIAELEAARAGLGAGAATAATAYVPAVAYGPTVAAADATSSYELAAMYGVPTEAPIVEEVVREPRPDDDGGRWLPALLAGLVVAALIVGGVLLLGGTKKVTLPSVVGADQATAEITLRDKGFSTDTVGKVDDQPKGTVLGQSPEGGTKVKKGITVTLTVSEGPGQGVIPDVSGKGRKAAYKALRAAGFKVKEREQNDDTVAKDHVIGTSPPVNSQFDRGQTVISIVSLGPPKVTVPQFTGQTQDEAQAAADSVGLKLSVTKQESAGQDPGTVLSQDKAAGSSLTKGGTVAIVVAKAPGTTAVPDVTGKTDNDAVAELSGAGFKVVQKSKDVATADQDGVVLSQSPTPPKQLKPGQTVTIVVGSYTPTPTTTTPTTPTTTTPTTTTPTTTTPGATP